MKTRRSFVTDSLRAGLAVAWGSAFERTAAASLSLDAQAIQGLRSNLKGRLVASGDDTYDAARRLFWAHSGVDKRPALIAQCAVADDIARCVEFARQRNLSLAVRAGGHSFLGFGTCSDGLVIDVSPLKAISVDPVRRTARVGAGVLAEELVRAAAPYGLAPVLGECPTVGIAGLTLGGGVGWLSAKYGATCDTLLSADLITTDSRPATASASVDRDLFWAIRGGGGNFGVVTSLEFQLQPVSHVLAGGYSYRLRDAPAILRLYRELMATAPDELQGLVTLTPANEGTINVIVVYAGDAKAGDNVLAPFRTIAPMIRNTVERRAFPETLTMPPYGEVVPTQFSAVRGAYLAQLSDEAIDVALDRYAQAPAGCAMGFDHYMHGQVCRVAADATPFELRVPGGVHVWIAPGWNTASDEPAFMRWADDTWTALHTPFSSGRAYANYQSAEGDDVSRAIFAGNYSRLQALKRKYDPDNVLQRTTHVRPS